MNVVLYQNLSEQNRVDKNLVLITTLNGTLRDGTSIINPTIRIESSSVNVIKLNYIYIEEWERYYFVGDILNIRKNIWEFTCHIDVLSTYKTQIKRLSAIIARQENLYNLYLDDDKFLVDAQRLYWTKAFPNRVPAGNSAGALSYILTLAGGEEVQSSQLESE